MRSCVPRLMRSWPLASLVTLLGAGTTLAQHPVLAGLDLLETDPNQTFEDLSNLGLLCPGCSVLGDPVIPMRGIPLEQDPPCPGTDLGSTDTILRRLQDTPPLFPGQGAQVETEIVQLHLQNVQPFGVDCAGRSRIRSPTSRSSTLCSPSGRYSS